MLCPNCNEPVANSALVCPSCQFKIDESRDWLTTLLLAIVLGKFGVHRFYTGHIGIGILMLCTLGCCGILWIYDIITIVTDSYRDHNGRRLARRH